MKKLQAVSNPEKSCDYIFWCLGCETYHGVWTTRRNGLGAVWTFNGDMERPTFNPSILLHYTKNPPLDPETKDFKRGPDGKYILQANGKLAGCVDVVCHLYIRNGCIEYLPDCTHSLAGKTVPMQDEP